MSIPGMIYPTQKALLSGNPRDSAMLQMSNTNMKQANLNAAVGGRKHKKGGNIPAPQYSILYTPQGGPGTDPNSQILGNLQTSTQSRSNASYDHEALKGGNSNWNWGCYSGGKRKSRRTRRTRRTRRIRRSKKGRTRSKK
jgi:hypothetical protein